MFFCDFGGTDRDLSQWKCNDRLKLAVSLIICASESNNYRFGPDSYGEKGESFQFFFLFRRFCLIYR